MVAHRRERRCDLRAVFIDCPASEGSLLGDPSDILGTKDTDQGQGNGPLPRKDRRVQHPLLQPIPLGDLFDEVRIETRSFPFCAFMTKNDTECRAFVCGDQMYEKIPADLIRRAAIRDVGP